MDNSMWGYQADSGYRIGTNLVGFKVEATDGHIGKVDRHSEDVDTGYIVVDTGPWIFGKQVLLPAGTITSVDIDNETVQIGRTKDEIKDSPEFDADKHIGDPDYHQQVGTYYDNGMPHS